MSYDASSLRGCLQRIDGSAPTIQGAAKAMMKHYDKSPQVAVNCWRDMLVRGSTRSDQFLPLLYVANEVLQNSKRNRGNRFLEAFSPVLGQSLAYVCGKSPPPVVESIRRTVKIWAERRVFSIRYVNELLKGLEAYRNNGSGSGKGSSSGRDSSSGRKGDADAYPETSMGSPGGSRFSPGPESPQEQDNNDDDDDNLFGDGPSTAASNNNNKTIDSMDESDNDHDHDHDNSDNDSIDDLFGNATTTTKRLQVDVDFDRAASLSSSLQQPNSSKRKRNSGGSGSGNNQRNSNSSNNNNNNSNKNSNKHKHNNKPGKRRNSAKQYLSATSLLDLMQQVSGLGHEAVVSELGDLRRAYAHDSDNDNDNSDGSNNNNNSSNNNNKDIESLVGHELLAAYRTTLKEEAKLANCRKRLRSIAETKRGLELEAFRYLPWLERALKQDADDLELFGATYRNQLLAFARVHEPTKNARDRRLAAEALRLEREREKQNRKREEEERKKFMESAMSKQTEAQPGMVWNRATGEYQHLNQEESWRD
eukprot:jgi/Psemu1/66614/estExt_Genemark1.C_2220025